MSVDSNPLVSDTPVPWPEFRELSPVLDLAFRVDQPCYGRVSRSVRESPAFGDQADTCIDQMA